MKPLPRGAVLWIIPSVYFVFVSAEFALMTHLALEATAAGRSALAVGLLATALWSGILLSSTLAHRLVQRRGHAAVLVGATVLALAATSSMALHSRFGGWLAGAFALGLAGGQVWVAGEAWLAEAAPADRRGFFVGIFETAVGLGLMTGPALLPLLRGAGIDVATTSAAMMALALAASTLLVRVPAPAAPAPDVGGRTAPGGAGWRAIALPLIGIALLSGLMEAGVSALLPSISMRMGQSLEAAAWLGAVIGAGSALLQPPAGHLADRIGTRRATLAAWAIVLAANLALWSVAEAPGLALWAVGFTLGGVGGAVYTLMIVELGHRLTGPALVRAVALLVTGYSLGTAAGPALGGALFDAGGLQAMAAALAALSAAGLAVSWRTLASAGAGAGAGDR
jgi:MFS family permease